MKETMITIEVGQAGNEFIQKNHLDARQAVKRQPAGLNFYQYRWPLENRGQVRVENGKYSFLIDGVLSLQGTEDDENRSRGIFNYSVTFGLSGGGDVPHDRVRLELYEFLKGLQAKGWRRVIPFYEPRLSGRSAYEYYLGHRFYSFPVDYQPTLPEWMKLGNSTTWILHADGVFLELRFRRNSEKVDPEQPGNYLFTATIQGKDEYAQSFFEPKDKDQWAALWQDSVNGFKRDRLKEEERLMRQGVEIDSAYEDPSINPSDSSNGEG